MSNARTQARASPSAIDSLGTSERDSTEVSVEVSSTRSSKGSSSVTGTVKSKPTMKEIEIANDRKEERRSSADTTQSAGEGEDEDEKDGPLPWEAIPTLQKGAGRTGLLNLGNTCYLNSVLQALSHVPVFTYYFAIGWPQAAPPLVKVSNRERYIFVECFATLMKALWSGKYREFSASQLTRAIIAAVPEFEPGCQQDAQEALNYILNNLHDELFQNLPAAYHPVRDKLLRIDAIQNSLEERIARTKSLKRPESNTSTSMSSTSQTQNSASAHTRPRSAQSQSPSATSAAGNGRKSGAAEGDARSQVSGEERQPLRQLTAPYQQSIVNDGMLMYLTQKVTCKRCGNSSISLEEYMELSVALPSKVQVKEYRRQSSVDDFDSDSDAGSRHSRSASRSPGTIWGSLKSMLGMSGHSLQLDDCFKAFFSEEVLEGDEQYHCEACDSKQDAVKTYRIAHLPDVLCVHLKRFNKVSGWSLGNSKNSTHVNFPLQDLDLCNYVFQAERTGGAGAGGLSHAHDRGCSAYDLVSVVRHTGGINSGHYISVCKNQADGKWYEYDDEFVSIVKPDSVCNADAYLLFYAKQASAPQVAKKKTVATGLKNSAQALQDWTYVQHCDPERPITQDVVFVPVYWVVKWLSMPSVGTVHHRYLVCDHQKLEWPAYDDLEFRVVVITRKFWKVLSAAYGEGDGPLQQLERCETCFAVHTALQKRRVHEHDEYIERDRIKSSTVFLVHSQWLQKWRSFVLNEDKFNGRGTWRGVPPPGQVTNGQLLDKEGNPKSGLRKQAHYRSVNRAMWEFFQETYGGGPVLERVNPDIYESPEVLEEVKAQESNAPDCENPSLESTAEEHSERDELTQDEEECHRDSSSEISSRS